jgi:hypothetical protein
MAVVVAVDVGVHGARHGGKSRKLAAVVRAAGKSVDESSAVGVAGGVDAGLVNAVVVLDAVDQIRGEDLVADARCRIRRALPVSL